MNPEDQKLIETQTFDCRDEEVARRPFFAKVSLALSGVIGLLITIPPVAFMLAPIFRKPNPVWRPVGKLEDFPIGDTKLVNYEDPSPEVWAGITATAGAWIRRESQSEFVAFSINCRHLGCPVRWIAGAELFMCPCHGGVYYKDGTVAAGPPPTHLDHLDVRVNDGQVEIQTAPTPLTLTKL